MLGGPREGWDTLTFELGHSILGRKKILHVFCQNPPTLSSPTSVLSLPGAKCQQNKTKQNSLERRENVNNQDRPRLRDGSLPPPPSRHRHPAGFLTALSLGKAATPVLCSAATRLLPLSCLARFPLKTQGKSFHLYKGDSHKALQP